MTTIFNGPRWAATEEQILAQKVRELKQNYNITPRLATILVGNEPASNLYVKLKKRAAQRLGCQLDILYFQKITSQDLIAQIASLNQNKKIHGIMIQLPLPQPLQKQKTKIINSIAPAKDVDGLRSNSPFIHPTSKAILDIIHQSLTPSKKNQIVIVGARGMVGKPLVKELKKEGFKVIACHSQTKNLASKTLKADVLVTATGTPNLIKAAMVKRGVAIIDVGAPKADVHASVAKKARFITLVPGGVGPVTITCLLENLLRAAYNITTKHTHQTS